MFKIGITGGTGHFGKAISKKVITENSNLEFVVYGRTKPDYLFKNLSYRYYNFLDDKEAPFKADDLDLLMDLSGPVKEFDGVVLRQCLKANVPCMDIAIHNSHLQKALSLCKLYANSTALVYFGVFPGLSNLLISRGFEIQEKKSGVLANEFPVYAGGGKNVSISLKDMLDESASQKNIESGKEKRFLMHSVKRKLSWNKRVENFYQWEYPEIESFLYSNPDTVRLERYFTLKPGWLNLPFGILVKLWNTPLRILLSRLIPALSYRVKSTLFKNSDPPFQMNFYDETANNAIIRLKVKNSVVFHGEVMSAFVKKLAGKKLKPGIYTPEQLFRLEEILPEGKYENYELIIEKG